MQELAPLSIDDQMAISGGDWIGRYWGFMLGMAFLGGALATPAFLGMAAMTGAALLATDYMVTNNLSPFPLD